MSKHRRVFRSKVDEQLLQSPMNLMRLTKNERELNLRLMLLMTQTPQWAKITLKQGALIDLSKAKGIMNRFVLRFAHSTLYVPSMRQVDPYVRWPTKAGSKNRW